MAKPISKAMELTALMLDARDAMRGILGDRYDDRIQPYREAIRRRAAQVGGNRAVALGDCTRALRVAGLDTPTAVGMLAAAACEEIEGVD